MTSHEKLTASDPQPGLGAIVRDDLGRKWENTGGEEGSWANWRQMDDSQPTPATWNKVAGNYGPVTLLSGDRLRDAIDDLMHPSRRQVEPKPPSPQPEWRERPAGAEPCRRRGSQAGDPIMYMGSACVECGHTRLVHPGLANPALDACVICVMLASVR